MSSVWRNIRFGFRTLLHNKPFTAAAILALALGIGPNVAIFSIIWATFLAPLPYPNAKQLVVVWNMANGQRQGTRADDYLQYKARSTSFQRLDFDAWADPHFTNKEHAQEEISGASVTPGFYASNLGYGFFLGRDFLPDEGVPGRNHVVILTHRLWRERFHSDLQILGRSVAIEDEPFTVVGVEAAGASDRAAQLFAIPVALHPGGGNGMVGNIFGRLKPGVTPAAAQAELANIDEQIAALRGEHWAGRSAVSVEPLKNDWLDKKLERNLWLLLAAVGFVLLIACANVANLLLARGASRQREIAVRSALGASRTHIFAQLLTESLTLALVGGIVGIALGWGLIRVVMAVLPSLNQQTIEADVQLNLPVLCFATLASMLAGVLFGCAPALQAAKLSLSDTLKQVSLARAGRRGFSLQSVLVIGEVALAITLLSSAGMALHSFWKLSSIDLGLRTDHLLTGWLRAPRPPASTISAAASAPRNPAQINADARDLLRRLQALPGIAEAAITTTMPFEGYSPTPFRLVGEPVPEDHRPAADFELATASYFHTAGIQLVEGRLLADSDDLNTAPVAVVNESFVRRYLSGNDPLQHALDLGSGQGGQPAASLRIVGVFHDVTNGAHLTDQPLPQVFGSFWQNPYPSYALLLRTRVDPGTVSNSLRHELMAAAPGRSLSGLTTVDAVLDTQIEGDRSGMVLFGGFAAVALLLAALGIYSVMAFSVAQRRQEIGLRMALGAQRAQVTLLVVRRGCLLAICGIVIGTAGTVTVGRLMHSTLYAVQGFDLMSFGIVIFVLLVSAALASWIPARRAARVDPLVALRQS